MPPDAQPTPPLLALEESVRRWRTTLGLALAGIAVLLIVGFTAERLATRLTTKSANILRAATQAQRRAWETEALARAHLLALERRDDQATRLMAERDSLLVWLNRLEPQLRDSPAQSARLTALRGHLRTWDSVYVRAALEGEPLTRTLALEGTAAYDAVAEEFDAIIGAETDLRWARSGFQSRLLWTVFILSFACLLVGGRAALRLARQLQEQAHEAAERQQRIEEQAVELETQASILEEQAAQLEEQATELRERIAERDETNRQLTQTTTLLDSAIASAPFGIAFYDTALRFQRINEALAAINGPPADHHLGRKLEEVLPDLAPIIRPLLERVLASNQAVTNVVIEGETPARPGEHRRWLCTYYPIARRGQAPVGVGCMVLDVTDQHRLEQQLRQAQKLEAVGRLAGGIAHDFNNVLTVIQSYAEVLALELEGHPTGQEELTAIRGAADRAAALARQLLAFGRRDVIIPRDVDVNAVIRGMELILNRLVRQGIELRIVLHPDPLVVRMDAGQLEQVVMNLALNAVDAMPDGGHLTVETTRGRGAEGAIAQLHVSDDGSGMPPAVQERLFEPFFTTKPPGRGTGLGLATSYAIVQEAKGRIDVASTVGRGSRFTVTLPISERAAGATARPASPARGLTAARAGEVVLLAEDEPAIRAALSRVLNGSGYRVLEAADGGEALRLAQHEPGPIHILLTDVMMPGVGGKELVRRLLAIRPDTRIVMMSGYTDDTDLRQELGGAPFVFLQKPFAVRQVLAVIREVLDGA